MQYILCIRVFSIKSYKRFISMAENQLRKASVSKKNLHSQNFESGYGPVLHYCYKFQYPYCSGDVIDCVYFRLMKATTVLRLLVLSS